MPHPRHKMARAEAPAAATVAGMPSAAASPTGEADPPAVPRPRKVAVQRFPGNRRLVTAALRAGRHKTPMYGFLAIDHDVIDGAPAARFAAEPRDVLETAAVLMTAAKQRTGDSP